MKKTMTLFMALALMVSVLTGCGAKDTGGSGKESDTIKIGLNYELSGNVATYGQSSVAGIELAIDEVNKDGGVLGKQIELIKVDNKSDSAEAANVSTRLATRDKVVAILGPATSGNTKGATPPAMQNKVPLISSSATDDDVTVDSNGKVREYIFKTCFNDSFQGVTMANFAFNDLKLKNAAILFDNTSDYAKGLMNSFKKTYPSLGGKILVEETYQAKETDFKAVLTKIKSTNPEVIYIPGYYEEVGLIVKQARELGIEVPVLGGDGYDSPKLLEIANKDSLHDVYYTNHYSPMDTAPEVVAFKEAFLAKNGKDADAFNALGYDLAKFLVDAIDRAGEANSEKIKDALASTKDFKGVTGSLSIDENHNPVKAVTILELVDGEPKFLKKLEP
ncbi:ABC transporter substrate-binding protein [Tissierella creatinophila]|uniref:Leucine-, isoleucine-, valine-, threonine-, and alanine-binding protein n=1 Tax=Tissierella creatinophila DSM 6911 TaxID=1123403 RepID=A0A1U7M8Y6_TISCR|nr:ABC transporter substrate-binding protein [Tissierella creatinophila]OLS03679.1 leucine-, isoleucine-, valine-, threonine-, and alanine-binding protein precursor [Tissierella creatinophila DSM 6911]